MAKKRTPKMSAAEAPVEPRTVPVRLDLEPGDHDRLERQARKLGLKKATYARMKVLQGIAADEREESK